MMTIPFEEVTVSLVDVPEEYSQIMKAVYAANDPPNIQSAQQCYLFCVEGGVILRASRPVNSVQAIVEFMLSDDWTHAVIPYSIIAGGAVLSYSVLHKPKETTCRKSWFGRLSILLPGSLSRQRSPQS